MWVLMVFFLAGYGPRLQIHTHDFATHDSCVAAGRVVAAAWKADGNHGALRVVMCVEK